MCPMAALFAELAQRRQYAAVMICMPARRRTRQWSSSDWVHSGSRAFTVLQMLSSHSS